MSLLSENIAGIVKSPGFPFVRLNPALFEDEVSEPRLQAGENLLLALHCKPNQLLVISDKNVTIYEVPATKTIWQVILSIIFDQILGRIPLIGDLLDVIDQLSGGGERARGFFSWIWGLLTNRKKKIREMDARLAAEGMPTSEEYTDNRWNFRDKDTYVALSVLRDRILLENGYHWKKRFTASCATGVPAGNQITFESKGVRLQVNGKSRFTAYADKKYYQEFTGQEWNAAEVAADLMAACSTGLAEAGWTLSPVEARAVGEAQTA